MSKSLSVTFRLPADMVEVFTSAVSDSGTDKTTWLIDAISQKLSQPDNNSDSRALALLERMETAAAALIGGKQGIPPTLYNEAAVIAIVVDTIKQGFDNGRIIAERINEAGYQTLGGKAWDKDIYSSWRRKGNHFAAVTAALQS